jgi:hypothetical protein
LCFDVLLRHISQSSLFAGTSFGVIDQICAPCATCGQDQYIVPCGDGVSEYLEQPPPDADKCLPCRACSEGYYTSHRCNGSTTYDTRQCSRCDLRCPFGTYMQANCTGHTFAPDTNDCRPCTTCNTGEYMGSGRCVDGKGATNALQRTCRSCTACGVGEYRLSVCTGAEAYDIYECAQCDACPVGSYLSKPCDCKGTLPSSPGRECTDCTVCPRGYYRVGCNVPGTGESHSTRDDVQCMPCDTCPDGHFISDECPGTGFSPTERTCQRCSSCSNGGYYATGCTGMCVLCKWCVRTRTLSKILSQNSATRAFTTIIHMTYSEYACCCRQRDKRDTHMRDVH